VIDGLQGQERLQGPIARKILTDGKIDGKILAPYFIQQAVNAEIGRLIAEETSPVIESLVAQIEAYGLDRAPDILKEIVTVAKRYTVSTGAADEDVVASKAERKKSNVPVGQKPAKRTVTKTIRDAIGRMIDEMQAASSADKPIQIPFTLDQVDEYLVIQRIEVNRLQISSAIYDAIKHKTLIAGGRLEADAPEGANLRLNQWIGKYRWVKAGLEKKDASSGAESTLSPQGIVRDVLLARLEQAFPDRSEEMLAAKGRWQQVVLKRAEDLVAAGTQFHVEALEDDDWKIVAGELKPDSLAARLYDGRTDSPIVQLPAESMVDDASEAIINKVMNVAKQDENKTIVILVEATGWKDQFAKFYDIVTTKLKEAGLEANLILKPVGDIVHQGEYNPTVQQALRSAKKQLGEERTVSEVLAIGSQDLIKVDEAGDDNIYDSVTRYLSKEAEVIAASLDYNLFPKSRDGTPFIAGLTSIVNAGIQAFGNVGIIEFDPQIPGIEAIYLKGRTLYVVFTTTSEIKDLDRIERLQLSIAHAA